MKKILFEFLLLSKIDINQKKGIEQYKRIFKKKKEIEMHINNQNYYNNNYFEDNSMKERIK